MKVMAIATASATLTPEQFDRHITHEAPATLQLYLDGKVEQFWFREGLGPIFLMNVESLEEAKATLNALPFVEEKLMTYEFMPVMPLAPLGRLIHSK